MLFSCFVAALLFIVSLSVGDPGWILCTHVFLYVPPVFLFTSLYATNGFLTIGKTNTKFLLRCFFTMSL